MLAVSLSRCVLVTTLPLFCLTTLARSADSQVQLLPTESPTAPVSTISDDDSKLILAAGEQASAGTERPQVTPVSEGTSSRRARKAAIEDLALQRLPWQNQQLVQGIVDNVSIFRRLPSYRCEVEPQVHDYFVHHPDVAVSIWRAMGISQLQMNSSGDWSYTMDTQDGTTGAINVLYRSRESCLIMCDGMFKSPYLQTPIAARSVMHLRTSFSTDPNGRNFAVHQADMFVTFPSQKVETVAKLISPVSNVIIDRNFQEISLFIHVMWMAMGRQPGWIEQLVADMDGVNDQQRTKLIKLTAKVYVDTQAAIQRQSGRAVTLDAIRPPTAEDGGTQPVSASQSSSEQTPININH